MADTIISDAVVGIQDEGLPNISDGNEDWGSAGLRMMLAQAVDSDSYVRSDSELTFNNHDGTNDQVDVTAGVAYLDLTGETVNVQSGLGGSSPPSYDTALPTLPAIPVIAPTTTADLDVQDSTLSSVWIAYATDSNVSGVSTGDIYLRSDDTGSVSAPPHPNAEIGQANPDDASADTLLNRFGSPTFADLDVQTVSTGEASVGTVSNQGDIFKLTDRRTPSSNTSSLQFTGLDGNTEYKIWISTILTNVSSPGDFFVRFNGDGGSTGDYFYWDESATRQSGENEILIMSYSAATDFATTLNIAESAFGGTSRRAGVDNQFIPGGLDGRIDGFSREGGYDGPLDSIELELDNAELDGGSTVVELWERDYA